MTWETIHFILKTLSEIFVDKIVILKDLKRTANSRVCKFGVVVHAKCLLLLVESDTGTKDPYPPE